VDLHPAIAIVNEAQLPKSVQEKADPRAGRAHHLREGLLTHLGITISGTLPCRNGRARAKPALVSFRWN
jgi:hypothetical protein